MSGVVVPRGSALPRVLLCLSLLTVAHAFSTSKCDPGWTDAGHDVCYRRLGDAVNLWQAQSACGALSGRLAVVRSAAQDAVASQVCDNIASTANCWIALSKATDAASGYRWMGGGGTAYQPSDGETAGGSDDTRTVGGAMSGWGYGEASVDTLLPLCEKPGASVAHAACRGPALPWWAPLLTTTPTCAARCRAGRRPDGAAGHSGLHRRWVHGHGFLLRVAAGGRQRGVRGAHHTYPPH